MYIRIYKKWLHSCIPDVVYASVDRFTELDCNGTCVSGHQICDGWWDCDNGIDELYCHDTCSIGFIR